MKTESLSVIIPTINAAEELDLCLSSIEKNSDLKNEIIVVVDPDPKTGKVDGTVLKVCASHGVKPAVNDKNLGPYGNWNRGAELASTDWLVFATDDQYFAPHWDANLLKYYKPKRLVAGRLVEPGIIPVWPSNVERDFGSTPVSFRETEFLDWISLRTDAGFTKDGFFIPLLQHRKDYKALGGYPTEGKFGSRTAKSNDIIYVEKAKELGYEFGTAADSYSYHFQGSSWKKKNLKAKIVAVILTNNEEKDLPIALKSVSWADEVVILDSGSTDKTLDIAKKHDATILTRKFDNFANQRNYALDKVKSDWILMIDADEECEPGLAEELRDLSKDIYVDGAEIPRKNFIFGRWIEHTDWYPDYRLVFFRPDAVRFDSAVHERALPLKKEAIVVNARHHLIHNNYDSVGEYVQKNLVEYPQKYAKQLVDQGYHFEVVDLFVKPIDDFFRRFFFAKGYRDGIYGLVLSMLVATSTLLSYIYVWEMQGKDEKLESPQITRLFASLAKKGKELQYWLLTWAIESAKGSKKLTLRLRRKALKAFELS